MRNNFKRSNAGFSLVEILVVIAIMGVLMGGSLITYYTVSSNNVKKSAGFISDAMTECRSRAMTTQAESWEVRITKENVKVYKVEPSGSELLIVGNDLPKHVAVSLVQGGTGTEYDLFDATSGYDSIVITYKLLSGEINTVKAYKAGAENVIYDGSQDVTYFDIVCDYENKKSRSLRAYYTTGKHVTLK